MKRCAKENFTIIGLTNKLKAKNCFIKCKNIYDSEKDSFVIIREYDNSLFDLLQSLLHIYKEQKNKIMKKYLNKWRQKSKKSKKYVKKVIIGSNIYKSLDKKLTDSSFSKFDSSSSKIKQIPKIASKFNSIERIKKKNHNFLKLII